MTTTTGAGEATREPGSAAPGGATAGHGRPRFAVLLVLVAVAVGYLGQGSFRIGARSHPPAVGALAVGVIGGNGPRQPADLLVTISVRNDGSDSVTVLGAEVAGPGVDPVGLEPATLRLTPGQVVEVRAEVSVDCAGRERLQLPGLLVELADGDRRSVPVGGAGLLLEACARSAQRYWPLQLQKSFRDGESLVLELTSPTGRRVDLVGVRAGGVSLKATPKPAALGQEAVTVRLAAPGGCAAQWQVPGIPAALSFDVANGTGPPGSRLPPSTIEPASVGTVLIRIGPVLTDWLLATSCRDGT